MGQLRNQKGNFKKRKKETMIQREMETQQFKIYEIQQKQF